jgi:hypothetical protein
MPQSVCSACGRAERHCDGGITVIAGSITRWATQQMTSKEG